MNDPLEHATGIEKREILAKQAGREVKIVCVSECCTIIKKFIVKSIYRIHMKCKSTKELLEPRTNQMLFPLLQTIVLLDVSAKKMLPPSTGCGFTKVNLSAVNVATGLNWLIQNLFRLT